MRAIECIRYGPPDVLQLSEIDKPTPKDNEVLIKLHAATVTAGDSEIRSMSFPIFWLRILMRIGFGFRGPRKKILGQEFAGIIESVGKDVKLFKVGDQIFAPTDISFGAYTEYKCVRENYVMALKPTNMTFEEAATIPTGGLNALHFIRKANIQPGQKVLINGAGGSIGTVAIQLVKNYGAEVIAVDSGLKFDMLRSLGADRVIDYTQEDFTKSGETFDVIFDIVGKTSFSRCIKSLTKNGTYLLANPTLIKMARGKWVSMRSSKKAMSGVADYTVNDLNYLKELIEEGKLKPVIDKRYPLEKTAEAHRYVDTGNKKGNVVITIVGD